MQRQPSSLQLTTQRWAASSLIGGPAVLYGWIEPCCFLLWWAIALCWQGVLLWLHLLSSMENMENFTVGRDRARPQLLSSRSLVPFIRRIWVYELPKVSYRSRESVAPYCGRWKRLRITYQKLDFLNVVPPLASPLTEWRQAQATATVPI